MVALCNTLIKVESQHMQLPPKQILHKQDSKFEERLSKEWPNPIFPGTNSI